MKPEVVKPDTSKTGTDYSVKPVHCSLRPSHMLACLLGIASLASMAIVICMPLAGWSQAILCLVILPMAAWHMARDAWLSLPGAWQRIEVLQGVLFVQRRDGRRYKATVLPESFVASYLVVLRLRLEDERRAASLVLMPDSADADSLRRLRVWLRWRSQALRETASIP